MLNRSHSQDNLCNLLTSEEVDGLAEEFEHFDTNNGKFEFVVAVLVVVVVVVVAVCCYCLR